MSNIAPPAAAAVAHNAVNNFDLIRLAAAIQVVVYHGLKYLYGEENAVLKVIQFVPGVPIFFFVSGYLISASYDRSRSMGSYARKRALRIFPALWLCIALTVLALTLDGYLRDASPTIGEFGTWVAAQSSFLQFYNPEWSRHYGAGIINSALWTITVEMQFYVMMPVLAWVFHRTRSGYALLFAGLVAFSAFYSLVIHRSAFGSQTSASSSA